MTADQGPADHGPAELRLRSATIEDGSTVDVDIAAGRISAVRPATGTAPASPTAQPQEPPDRDSDGDRDRDSDGDNPADATEIDLTGHLLLPAPAEPHGHLDKALTADVVANPRGDLGGAIEAWLAHRPTIPKADYVQRATAAALMSAANGCTALRTHIDVGPDIGTAGVEALLEVKETLAPLIDLQLVCLNGQLTASNGAENLAVMRAALELGVDVVGGVPHIEDDPARAIDLSLDLAGRFGRPIDLHADETLNPDARDLQTMSERILATGFGNGAVASHCVALGMKPAADQTKVAELAAEARVAVVALPQTNLFLQARGVATAPPRGLTALAALAEAGATVAGGADNLRDPFCLVGRADPLETASLLVMAGHLTPSDAYTAVSAGARSAMGLEPVTVAVGSPADLVAIPAGSVGEAVAAAPSGRIVVRQGQVRSAGSAQGR